MTFDLDLSLDLLSRTPDLLSGWLSGLEGPWLTTNEGPDTWSPYDVMGHLVHGERTDWMARVRIILSDSEERTFAPFDRFAQFQDSAGKSIDDLLAEFSTLRMANLAAIQALKITPKDFDRGGIHPALGPVSLSQLLATWVVHDLNHIGQIARVMAGLYRDEVGPWQAYLRILGGKG